MKKSTLFKNKILKQNLAIINQSYQQHPNIEIYLYFLLHFIKYQFNYNSNFLIVSNISKKWLLLYYITIFAYNLQNKQYNTIIRELSMPNKS